MDNPKSLDELARSAQEAAESCAASLKRIMAIEARRRAMRAVKMQYRSTPNYAHN